MASLPRRTAEGFETAERGRSRPTQLDTFLIKYPVPKTCVLGSSKMPVLLYICDLSRPVPAAGYEYLDRRVDELHAGLYSQE